MTLLLLQLLLLPHSVLLLLLMMVRVVLLLLCCLLSDMKLLVVQLLLMTKLLVLLLPLLRYRVVHISILVLVAPHWTATITEQPIGLRYLAYSGIVVLAMLVCNHTTVSTTCAT